ncbi:MAG: B12-binding domain-containing radical SAM protein, partial [Nitrospirota bacterium]
SPLYAQAKEKGWSLPDDAGGPGWIGYSQHAYDTLPLPTDRLAATQVLDFRDRAFQQYFQSAGYLTMLDRTFGPRVVQHVTDMCAHNVRRRHHDLAAAPAA